MTQLVKGDRGTNILSNRELQSISGGLALRNSIVDTALSKQTLEVSELMGALRIPTAPSVMRMEAPKDASHKISLDERLFDARAAAKQMIARVAMHIEPQKRARLFKQIDSLHALADWNEDDTPLQADSFESFLQAIFYLAPSKFPSLGMSYAGHLLAAWTRDDNRLVIEFLPMLRARWSASRSIAGQIEHAAGENKVSRLSAVLAPYEPGLWLQR